MRAKKHFLDELGGNTCSTDYVFTGFKCHKEPWKRQIFSRVVKCIPSMDVYFMPTHPDYAGVLQIRSWGPFLESPENFSGAKSCFVFVMFVCKVKVSRILRYYDTMKLSVNKEKLTGLWARNYATILQVLILKFAFGLGKFPGLSKNRPLISCSPARVTKSAFEVFCAWAWNFAPFPKSLIFLFIVWYQGYFCMNLITDKDFFIITLIKVNFGSMCTVSHVRFQI